MSHTVSHTNIVRVFESSGETRNQMEIGRSIPLVELRTLSLIVRAVLYSEYL